MIAPKSKPTLDELAREARKLAEERLLESILAYDRVATKKLARWGIAEADDE